MLEHITVDDGVDLYYQTTGSGPAVVFLHGFGGNHLTWWRQVPVFAESYRCLAPDQRTFGLSGAEPLGPEAAASFVDDLLALLDHVGVDRVAVVGHSMSGWPAASLATEHPERVAALVLSGTPGGLLSPERHHELVAEATVPDVDPLSAELSFLSESISELNVNSPAEWTDVRPVLDEHLPTDAERIVDAGVPAFLIAGEGDGFMPRPAVEAVAERLDGAEFAVVEGAGHSVNVEAAAAFNRHVEAFLERETAF